MEVEVRTQFYDQDQRGYNVVAEIPGTDKKDEVVLLGGHIDSWSPGTGAADNGAGVAVSMEAVRILKALGVKPRRTIRVVLWSAEEKGWLGSRAYVEQHFGEVETMTLKPEHAKVSAYFNYDNGTGRIRGINLQQNLEVGPIFAAWMQPFADLGMTQVVTRSTGGSDHGALDYVGIPAFQWIQDPIDYSTRVHHSNMDVYDHLVPEDLIQSAVITASFVYHTAMRDEMLPRKPLPPPFDVSRSPVMPRRPLTSIRRSAATSRRPPSPAFAIPRPAKKSTAPTARTPSPTMSAWWGVTWISCHFVVASVVIPNSVMKPSTVMKKPLNSPSAPSMVTTLPGPLGAALGGLLPPVGQRAVGPPVEPVDHHPEVEPDEKAHPGGRAEAQHQVEARDDPEDRKEEAEGHLEGPAGFGALDAQHDDGGAHDHEGEQRADRRHLPDEVDRENGGKDRRRRRP